MMPITGKTIINKTGITKLIGIKIKQHKIKQTANTDNPAACFK
jgi:hypothetical protein